MKHTLCAWHIPPKHTHIQTHLRRRKTDLNVPTNPLFGVCYPTLKHHGSTVHTFLLGISCLHSHFELCWAQMIFFFCQRQYKDLVSYTSYPHAKYVIPQNTFLRYRLSKQCLIHTYTHTYTHLHPHPYIHTRTSPAKHHCVDSLYLRQKQLLQTCSSCKGEKSVFIPILSKSSICGMILVHDITF